MFRVQNSETVMHDHMIDYYQKDAEICFVFHIPNLAIYVQIRTCARLVVDPV